ncbi:VOC family protein [Arcobacteraceae bacterium]|nr:VOC family protein [Arcobacteraceae bacterium]
MKVGHVGINVNDMQISKRFYMELFDFEIIFEETKEDRKYIFLGHDGEIVVTLWEQSDKKFSTNSAGLHHLAFIVDTIDELIIFEKKLELLKVEKIYDKIVSHAEGADSGGIYFYGPDSVRLEVCVATGIDKCNPGVKEDSSCGFF